MSDGEEDFRELLRQQRRIRRKLKKEEKRKENEFKRLNLNSKDTHLTIVQRNSGISLQMSNRQNNEEGCMSPTNLQQDDFPFLGQGVERRSRSQNSNISQNSNLSEPIANYSNSAETLKKITMKVKKSKAPVVFNLEEMIKADPNPFIATLKQNMKINSNADKSVASNNKLIVGGNMLDSSQPIRKRHKQREIPKPKRPNTFKSTILKERENDNHIISSMDMLV